jgi:hypothetical protein
MLDPNEVLSIESDDCEAELPEWVQNITEHQIYEVCMDLAVFLIKKNRKYGNSAIEPVRVFSDAPPDEQIKVRKDDKLSRLMSGQANEDEDPEKDLVGYWVLGEVIKRCQK